MAAVDTLQARVGARSFGCRMGRASRLLGAHRVGRGKMDAINCATLIARSMQRSPATFGLWRRAPICCWPAD